MKNKSMAIAFGVFVAILVALAPFSVWQIWLGDSLYDSVFTSSLSELPVVRAGRAMPISSASADILKSIGGKATAKTSQGKISATKWLWTINSHPEKSADEKFFRTDNRELQTLLKADGRNYSYNSFADNYQKLLRDSDGNSHYARACNSAINSGFEYATSCSTFGVRFDGEKYAKQSIDKWNLAVKNASDEFKNAQIEKREPNHSKLVPANVYLGALRRMAEIEDDNTSVRVVPLTDGKFESAVSAMLDRKLPSQSERILKLYAQIRDAIADDNQVQARKFLVDLNRELRNVDGINFFKIKFENVVNALDPFFCGFVLYGLSMLCLAMSAIWRKRKDSFIAVAFVLLAVAVAEHCFGITARMYIQMRPPVTNLYSSVVFAGLCSALVGLVLFVRRKVVSFAFASAITGFLSLLVAMNLPYSGDTMGMMRAVLNSNFWLTIHVVTIMVGYCGLFLAGFMAWLRLVANVFSRENFGRLTSDTANGVYAVLCFALVFSFAGTMLGGIWADMSWGRFWGWDPKENGALMVVLWIAGAIHAKTLHLCSDRIFLAMAVLGNVVGAWAWFGVNLMGVGLHSYGFVEGGWMWFFAFVISQLLICPLSLYKYREKNGTE